MPEHNFAKGAAGFYGKIISVIFIKQKNILWGLKIRYNVTFERMKAWVKA
jgi:hypothetical protein